MQNKVYEKGYCNNPLTEVRKAKNKERFKTRVPVGHVFGFMEQSMQGFILKFIGSNLSTRIIGLINLTYNLFGYKQVVRQNILPIGENR